MHFIQVCWHWQIFFGCGVHCHSVHFMEQQRGRAKVISFGDWHLECSYSHDGTIVHVNQHLCGIDLKKMKEIEFDTSTGKFLEYLN